MKGFMRKKSEHEHTHSSSSYQPEFGIGDSVFIWGTVYKIKIDADGVCFNPTRDSLIECAKPYWLYDDEYEQLELNDCAADEDDDLYKE